ncbi:S1 family peptidase [Streptomyces sp. PR69]|uniref:S1 family peptidase n=1 Tax=Streptomyces sp. PR69 TaxID=2984950 RepID=UPI0022655BB0|nr:S1 family peptidase [Streptomyces sp. PR69]
MTHRYASVRRSVAAVGTGAAILLAALLSPSAGAAPAGAALSSAQAGGLAHRLTSAEAGGAAGAYYDATARKLVVNVVDGAAADRVRRAGAEPRTVKYSQAQLESVRTALRNTAKTPHTSWAVDVRANKVVVTADQKVGPAAFEKLQQAASAYGDKAEVRRTAGTFRQYIRGGDAVYANLQNGEVGRCSLGFNVVDSFGTPYFLTAGHCTDATASWSDSPLGGEIGTTAGGSFPYDDFGIVRYTAPVDHPSEVNLYDGSAQPIHYAADAYVGQHVFRSGSSTGLRDGEVLALDVSVDYGEGNVVHGLVATNACAAPGDSGGPFFAGDAALGLTSGGDGDCVTGGTTFFQPVTEPLAVYGVHIG